MEEVINNHLQRMKNLQSVYEERTGQHNILGILINELTEQLRQYNVVRQSEQLVCRICGTNEEMSKDYDLCYVCWKEYHPDAN